MTRAETATLLLGFVAELKIDPRDACLIYSEVEVEGIDAETLGDQLDGAGYPELAAVAYGAS